MPGTQAQAGIVTGLEDKGSGCRSLKQATVLQVTGSIPMGPLELRLLLQNSGAGLGPPHGSRRGPRGPQYPRLGPGWSDPL